MLCAAEIPVALILDDLDHELAHVVVPATHHYVGVTANALDSERILFFRHARLLATKAAIKFIDWSGIFTSS
ncbi:hypothetical protein PFUM301597_02150 [Pseudomonas fluorescens]